MTTPRAKDYEDWARATHGAAFRRRSAERNAAFLLPHLRPGQRLLDVGCGPGAITAGLAARVAPGETVGVDRDAPFLEQARQLAPPTARFEEADAAALPFDDASFDVAFSHAVLQHVESPEAVVAELVRVLRPGGIVAVADADLDGFLLHPRPDGLDEALAIDRRSRRHPDVGRRLPELLTGAGFVDVEFTVQSNVVSGAAVAGMAASSAARLEAAPFVERLGLSAADAERAADGWRAWGAAPGAVFVTWWCQAIGRAPEQVQPEPGSK